METPQNPGPGNPGAKAPKVGSPSKVIDTNVKKDFIGGVPKGTTSPQEALSQKHTRHPIQPGEAATAKK